MKFKYCLPYFLFIALVALCVVEGITIVYFMCKMFQLFGLTSNSFVLELATTIVCCLALAFSIFMLGLHYKLTATHMQLKFGFFNLLSKRIEISKILNVVVKDKKTVYISYIADTLDPVIVLVAIYQNDVENFTSTLKALNSKILITEE